VAGPLRAGDPIPPFLASDADGRIWTVRDFAGAPFVLYFYPKDETPGCTREAAAYNECWPEFQRLGVRVVGVSRDDSESHKRFAAKGCLPFILLSDPAGTMQQDFGATMLGSLPRRISYLVGSNGRVAGVFDSHLRAGAHAEKMLEAAKRLVATA
jgi:peroxiredoxin Q/BCP